MKIKQMKKQGLVYRFQNQFISEMRISLGIVLVASFMIVGARQESLSQGKRVLSEQVDRPAMFIPDHTQSTQPQQLPPKNTNQQPPQVPLQPQSPAIKFHESDQPEIKFLLGTMAIVPQIKESQYSIVGEIIYPKGNSGEKSRFVASVGGDGFVKKLQEKNKVIVKEVKAEEILKEEEIEQAKKAEQEKKQQPKSTTQQPKPKAEQGKTPSQQTKIPSQQQNLLSPQPQPNNIPSLQPSNTKVHLKQHQLDDPQPITDYKFQQQQKQLQKQEQQEKQRREKEQLEQEKKRKEEEVREGERKRKEEEQYKRKREEEIAKNQKEEEIRKNKLEEEAKKKEEQTERKKQEQLRKQQDKLQANKKQEQRKAQEQRKRQQQQKKTQQQTIKVEDQKTEQKQQPTTKKNTQHNPSVTKESPQPKQWLTSKQITQQFNKLTQLLNIPKSQLQTHLQTESEIKQKLQQKSTSYRILQLIVWGMIIVAICQAYCGNSQDKKIERGKYAPVESQLETEDNLEITSGERMQRI